VHIIFTGGTISMRVDPETGAAVPALYGRDIVRHVHGLRREARVTIEDYDRLPGPHVTPRWMWALKRRIDAVASSPSPPDGIVVAHGTDTIEETAFLVDLTTHTETPVVFCGAMRTVSDPGWDGPANLMTAVRAAAHPGSRGHGVLVAVGEHILAASEATKTHTQSLAAFSSESGPLGVVDNRRVRFVRPPLRRRFVATGSLDSRIDLHVVATGTDGRLLRASLDSGARGLVIEATGCGNVPPLCVPEIARALKDGVAVVIASRCGRGSVAPAYGYEGGGEQLARMGCTLAADLPGPKARVLLMAGLGAGLSGLSLSALYAAE
jgi:L-asparaginase